jgi:hydrogenase nickel insertion protein HypA
MHEWALAESILASAETTAKQEHLKTVTALTVNLGELQQIDRSILRFALKALATEHPLFTKAKFIFKTEKSHFTCNVCAHTWDYKDLKKQLSADEAEAVHFIPEAMLAYARCTKCGSPDFTITKGRGVTLTTVKGT